MSRDDIADYLGTSAETVTRALAHLEGEVHAAPGYAVKPQAQSRPIESVSSISIDPLNIDGAFTIPEGLQNLFRHRSKHASFPS